MEKFDRDLKELQDKIKECKLSDEFKAELKEKLDYEYMKPSENTEKVKKFVFPQRLVAAFACFFILISGCGAFADEIESWVAKVFSNTDKTVEEAIANGNYRKIDMDYVENEGISIKVDYIVVEDDEMYIAFNILTEEEYDNVYFEDMEIKSKSGEIMLNIIERYGDYTSLDRKINNKNIYKIYKIELKESSNVCSEVRINIGKIVLEQDEIIITKEQNWQINL